MRISGLWKLLDGRHWLWGKLGLALVGKDTFPCIDEFSQNLIAEKMGLPVPAGTKLDAPEILFARLDMEKKMEEKFYLD